MVANDKYIFWLKRNECLYNQVGSIYDLKSIGESNLMNQIFSMPFLIIILGLKLYGCSLLKNLW
jgi:hypothetical protein